MHLSSDSERYFSREWSANECVGWRFHFDCSKFTHVRLLYLNMEPFFPAYKTKKICKIYCNLISKSITDPRGTLAVIGGTAVHPREPGMSHYHPEHSGIIHSSHDSYINNSSATTIGQIINRRNNNFIQRHFNNRH